MKRKQILSKESEALFTRTVLGWGFISITVALVADAMRWDIESCALCQEAFSFFPFIVESTSFTANPAALEIQWMFMFLTTPTIVTLLLIRIKDFKRSDMRPLAFWFFLAILAFGVHIVGGGLWVMEKTTNFYARFYRETLLGGAVYSITIWILVAGCAYFVVAYLVAFIDPKGDGG